MATTTRIIATLLSLVVVTGCGNDPEKDRVLKSNFQSLRDRMSGGVQSEQLTPEMGQIAQHVSAATDEPVTIIRLVDGSTFSVIAPIAENGTYQTFASADRRSITMQHGVVTATRGLSNDLMSSQSAATGQLVRARKSGSSTRVMRYLDGLEEIIEFSMDCTVNRGDDQGFSGQRQRQGTVMVETCDGSVYDVRNSYVVDGRGKIVESIQWLSPQRGYAHFLPLGG